MEKSTALFSHCYNEFEKISGTFRLPTRFYYINEQGQMEVQSVGFQGSHLFSAFVKAIVLSC